MHSNGCGAGLSHALNEACTAVRAPRLAKCSACSQTMCGSSFAPRTKAPGTSAMSCEHISRLDWSQSVPPILREPRVGPGTSEACDQEQRWRVVRVEAPLSPME